MKDCSVCSADSIHTCSNSILFSFVHRQGNKNVSNFDDSILNVGYASYLQV